MQRHTQSVENCKRYVCSPQALPGPPSAPADRVRLFTGYLLFYTQEHTRIWVKQKREEQAGGTRSFGHRRRRRRGGTIYTLTIIGQIEGHQALPENIKTTKYEHVIPLLAAVEESEEIDGCCCSTRSAGILRQGLPSRN